MSFFKRRIYTSIIKQLSTKPIVVLTGMRRSGKTTLLKKVFEEIKSSNKVYLDLENEIEQQIFDEKNFNNIWRNLAEFNVTSKNKAYIFLDEIQTAPYIVKAVKYLYDHYDVKFFITGSSSFYLKNLFPESLSGRKILFELFPLDFNEFLTFKQQSLKHFESFEEKDKNKSKLRYELYHKYFDEYLKYGGFPQVVLEDNIEQKKNFINDIFSSYFQKDVKLMADFSEIRSLQKLILLLMQRTGNKINISRLASELGLSRPTIYSYISFLEGTYFINLISPFSRNVDKEVSGASKVYICDNGFLSVFAKISEGSLFENAIYNCLKKYGKINYYEKRKSYEIDFILPEKNLAIEIKNSGRHQDLINLEKYAGKLNISNYYVITKNFIEAKGFIPALEI